MITDRTHYFVDRHVGTVNEDGIFCLFQRSDLSCHIPMIPLLNIRHDLFKSDMLSLCRQFFISAFCTGFNTGSQVNLYISIRQNICSNVPSIITSFSLARERWSSRSFARTSGITEVLEAIFPTFSVRSCSVIFSPFR